MTRYKTEYYKNQLSLYARKTIRITTGLNEKLMEELKSDHTTFQDFVVESVEKYLEQRGVDVNKKGAILSFTKPVIFETKDYQEINKILKKNGMTFAEWHDNLVKTHLYGNAITDTDTDIQNEAD